MQLVPDSLFSDAILIDTSAALALSNPTDEYYDFAQSFLASSLGKVLVVLNFTKYESYTRARYDLGYSDAISLYYFLSSASFYQVFFDEKDEEEARLLLEKYDDQDLSFHDALCATVMKKFGIYKAFAFDKHFYVLGFEVYPGVVH